MFKKFSLIFVLIGCTLAVELNRANLDELCECNSAVADTINLEYKDIDSINPNTFQGLTQLEHLYLDHNMLTKLEDDTFKGLFRLSVLSLSNNEIHTISENIFNGLTSLEWLHLETNHISTFNENALRTNYKLEYLNLDYNRVASFSKKTLVGLFHLDKVCIYDNPISLYFPNLLDEICVSNDKCLVYYSHPCPYGK